MDYLTSDKNTLIWLIFTVYAVSVILIIPNTIDFQTKAVSIEANNDRALQLASGLVLRTCLILPMLILLKNVV